MREEKITGDSGEEERAAAKEERRRLPVAGYRVSVRERLDGEERAATEEERFRVFFFFFFWGVRLGFFNITRPN
jgi:hypothetical protein